MYHQTLEPTFSIFSKFLSSPPFGIKFSESFRTHFENSLVKLFLMLCVHLLLHAVASQMFVDHLLLCKALGIPVSWEGFHQVKGER